MSGKGFFSRFSSTAGDPDENEPNAFEPLTHLLDRLANMLLLMTYQAGSARMQVLTILFMLSWIYLALSSHPIPDWQKLVLGVINPSTAPDISNPPLTLITALISAFLWPDVLGHLIALALPFWIALQFAAIFLDDIYELKDTSIASKFITQAAFVYPLYGVIHIENGDVRPQDRKSPIFKIGGGPGNVRVSLENVAVFERIDGTPDPIGPTAGNPFFIRKLDGFERLRQVIDIRDMTISIPELKGRTKDGIIITVQNIRLLFSVMRDSPYSTLSRPYPYSPEAILKLVYEQPKGPWFNTITGMVRGELSNFIREHTLGEIFAAVGEPEVNRQIEKQSIVQRHIWQHRNRSRRFRYLKQLRLQAARHFALPVQQDHFVRHYPKQMHPIRRKNYAQMERNNTRKRFVPDMQLPRRGRQVVESSPFLPAIHYPRRPVRWIPPEGKKFRKQKRYPRTFPMEILSGGATPNFIPRLQLSRRFYEEFAKSFPERAQNQGVRLEWIDVGTWHPPSGIILDQHLDAWRITTENMIRGDRVVLNDLRFAGLASELIRLVRRPIYRFVEMRSQGLNRDEMVYMLVEEYLGILRSARDEFMRNGMPIPDRLLVAIDHIQRYQRAYLRKNKSVHMI